MPDYNRTPPWLSRTFLVVIFALLGSILIIYQVHQNGKNRIEQEQQLKALTEERNQRAEELFAQRKAIHERSQANRTNSALSDDVVWLKATKLNPEGYPNFDQIQDYLETFPHGKHHSTAQALTSKLLPIHLALEEGKIQAVFEGNSIRSITLKLSLMAVEEITITIGAGDILIPERPSTQRMLVADDYAIPILGQENHLRNIELSLEVTCADHALSIPSTTDRFTIYQIADSNPLKVLSKHFTRSDCDWATKQAATWIVSDDADFSTLSEFTIRSQYNVFPGRPINAVAAVEAIQIIKKSGVSLTDKKIWTDIETLSQSLESEVAIFEKEEANSHQKEERARAQSALDWVTEYLSQNSDKEASTR